MKVRTEETVNQLVDIAGGAAITIGTQLAITLEHQGKMYRAVRC